MTPRIKQAIDRVTYRCILRGDLEAVVEEAILAERERCAKVAEQVDREIDPETEPIEHECVSAKIAAAIREDPSDG
jgi:hypothetical protein